MPSATEFPGLTEPGGRGTGPWIYSQTGLPTYQGSWFLAWCRRDLQGVAIRYPLLLKMM